ncbi:MAG: hypothetical protein ACP5NZ_03880 [Nanobdellota archaeon]
MTKFIDTKDLEIKEILDSLHKCLKNTKEDICIYYKSSKDLVKLESKILESFDERYLESGRIRFMKYS